MKPASDTVAPAAAVLAVLAMGYFAVAAVATHLVSPQYDPVRDYISDYAVGPQGWIYGSAFLASFVGVTALGVSMWAAIPGPSLSRAGVVLLVLAGITYAIDFVFPTDILAPGEPPQTTGGQIHFAAAFLGWVFFVAGAFAITRKLRRDPTWRRWHRPLLVLVWLALILLLALVAVTVAKQPIGGLIEKSFILDRNIWSLIVAIVILRGSAFRSQAGHSAPRLG